MKVNENARRKHSTCMVTTNAIIVWVVYVFIYTILKIDTGTTALAGYFSLIGEAGLDIVAVILTYRLWRKTEEKNTKGVFLVFFIAFIAAIAADGVYNVVLNLFKFQYINPIVVSFFDVPFALFLLLQLVAWGWILFLNNGMKLKINKLLYIPYAIASVLMFTMFMFGISWKIEYFSIIGLFQAIDTFLEVIGFALATMCLARARTQMIRFAAIGYLLVVSSDFIIRYDVVSGSVPYLSSSEASWVLGLLLMCLGFFLIQDNKSTELRLLPVNSLQSQIAIWLLILCLFSALMIAGSYYIFLSDSRQDFSQVTKNLLSMLIPFSVLAIIASSYISTKISSPLSRLENIISSFIGNDNKEIPITDKVEHNYIFEFIALENFVFDAFALYKKKHSLEMEFAKIAIQVAHDLKSPLFAIDSLSKTLILSDEERDVFSWSINGMQEITESLLTMHRHLYSENKTYQFENSSEVIFSLLEGVVLEKKIQFKNKYVNIILKPEKYTENIFCLINPANFKRVISNLINNAAESIEGNGTVSVILKREFNTASIEIKDTGCGIPKHVLDGLRNGISYKKEKGNGLGLQHAIKCIAEWNGSYHIDTKENFGTSFRIYLPIQEPPDWIQREIYFLENSIIVIVDDDLSTYDLWKNKLNKYNYGISGFKLIHLTSPEELDEYISCKYSRMQHKRNVIFFIACYFSSSNINGLDAIKNNCLSQKSILIAEQYPDKRVKDALCENKIRMVLKKDICEIPINIVFKNPDLILLDDKREVTKIWSLEAASYQRRIVVFNSSKVLMNYIDLFDKNTDIYLDSDLGGDEKGEDIAKKLYESGFMNLYITTGFDVNDFPRLPWVKGVIGKRPVFINDKMRVNNL